MSSEIGELLGNVEGGLTHPGAGAAAFASEPPAAAARTTRATVLFVDLRGYTALAERLAPTAVVSLLDEFFEVLTGATETHHGRIFYMVGDGMMAGFGVLDAAHDGAKDALAAAQAMLRDFAPIVVRWRRDLGVETGIGIGLHLGEVALGLQGPPGQRSSTLVGDTVNVAARLCGRARAGEVLFSSTVAACLQGDGSGNGKSVMPPCIRLPQFSLRGRSRPLDIWCMPVSERLAV
jgi:adenylate cyclase